MAIKQIIELGIAHNSQREGERERDRAGGVAWQVCAEALVVSGSNFQVHVDERVARKEDNTVISPCQNHSRTSLAGNFRIGIFANIRGKV